MQPKITHNARVAYLGAGSESRPIQSYCLHLQNDEDRVLLDFNGEPVKFIDLSPTGARTLIRLLEAALADAREE